jgi:tRNA threonylcarbamoyladenosine biosynthesis protein TsaB
MSAASPLVIETSTPHASIARVAADGSVEQRGFCSDRNHNALLFEPLQELLAGDGKPSLVLVGSGPGSYSGTRVGIAAAQGIAIAMGCPAVAVPSILAVPAAANGARCLAIGDARRGSFWTARIGDCRLLEEPSLCDAEELGQRIAQAVADGLSVFSFEDIARFPLTDELSALVKIEIPNATRLWKAWCGTAEETRRKWSAEIPQPLYLKPPHITPAKRPWLVQGAASRHAGSADADGWQMTNASQP